MARSSMTPILTGALVVLGTNGAVAGTVIDQEHIPTNSAGGLEITATQSVWQRFTVGLEGLLAQVDILQIGHHGCSPPNADLVFRIREIDGTDLELQTVPPSAVTGQVSFDVSTAGIQVAPGDELLIWLDSMATPSGCTYAWNGDNPGTYPGGFGPGGRDMAFRTWVQTSPTLICDGFRPPMDKVVTVRKHRALPLKAQLVDGDGFVVTDLYIVAAPAIQVIYDSGTAPAEDVTDEALSPGDKTLGNEFFFDADDQEWHHNLYTRNYSAAGTYTVTMVSGDDGEYTVDPTCEATFVINE